MLKRHTQKILETFEKSEIIRIIRNIRILKNPHKKIPRLFKRTIYNKGNYKMPTKLSESKLRSIIREELKKTLYENMGNELIFKLMEAMNRIRTKYDSKKIGQKVPEYSEGTNVELIKQFINDNVSDHIMENYLEELRTILEEQEIELYFNLDDYSEEGYLSSLEVNPL